MLYIIGGTSRSGKTLLSKKILAERKIPYFPLDALFCTLAEATPELGINHANSLKDRPLKMWKLAKPLSYFFEDQEQEYVLEGDSILPSQIKELINEGRKVKCCFLGYPNLNPDEKLQLIRKFHQGKSDWTAKQTDEQMLVMIEEMVEFSKYLKEECEKYSIKFFDVSHDFEVVNQEAFEYLFKG